MTMNAAEMDNLARATIKECVKVEVRQLVQENLAAVLTELLAELWKHRGHLRRTTRCPDGQPDKEVVLAQLCRASCRLLTRPSPFTCPTLQTRSAQFAKVICAATHTHLCVSEVELIEGVDLVTMSRSTLRTWPCVKWTTLSL
jgi:hypothetical protein